MEYCQQLVLNEVLQYLLLQQLSAPPSNTIQTHRPALLRIICVVGIASKLTLARFMFEGVFWGGEMGKKASGVMGV